MTVTPAPYYVKCVRTPTDPRESERPSGLLVVSVDEAVTVRSGVIEAIGSGVKDDEWTMEVGNVLYYLEAVRIGEHDFVIAKWENILGWEA